MKERKEREKATPSSIWGDRKGTVIESESFGVSTQKHDEVTERISSRVPIPIVSCTFMKNVLSCLNRVESTWTLELFIQEKL